MIIHDKTIFTEQQISEMAILLSQYEMQFMPQKAINGQVVVDSLADHPVSETSKLYDDLPGEIT